MVWEQGIAIIAMVTVEEVSPLSSRPLSSASNAVGVVQAGSWPWERKAGGEGESGFQTVAAKGHASLDLASHPDRRCACLRQEGGREKSFRYWPRLGSRHNTVTYGRFKITTRFRTDSGCYATTGLKMKHLLTGQERTVWHLQYTDWPEHGCPADLKGFLCKCLRPQHGPAWPVKSGVEGRAYFPEILPLCCFM